MTSSGLLNKDANIVSQPNPAVTKQLEAMLGHHQLWITADEAQQIANKLGVSIPQLMVELIPLARKHAVVPVSDFRVGSCSMGLSGNLYFGVNMEFVGVSLIQTVHSEQFTTSNAMGHGEKGLKYLAVSAAPCGYCRQFLNEMQGGSDLRILIPDKQTATLSELLPQSFGPQDLAVEAGMMAQSTEHLVLDKVDNVLAEIALDAANHSYAPYSHCASGVALRTKSGLTVKGWYAENAAYNPSLCPLQAALMMLVAEGGSFSEIVEAVLVERGKGIVSQTDNTRSLLAALAPEAAVSIYYGHNA